MTPVLERFIKAVRHLGESLGIVPLLLLAAIALPCPIPGAANIVGIGVLCPVQRILHLPCPGCGMTRSVVATAHGQLLTAIAFHPVGPFIFTWILYAALYRIPKIRRHLPVLSPKIEDALMTLLVIALLTIWGFRLVHLIPGPTTFP